MARSKNGLKPIGGRGCVLSDSKTKWVFLRGLVRESGHWYQFPRQFRAHFPQAEIHFLEIPGTGKKYAQESPLSIEAMVDSLQADFEAIFDKNEHPFVLSISLGSMVTLQWLNQYPNQFAGAVLMNTSISGLSPFYKRLQPHNYPMIPKLMMIPDPEKREKGILKLISNEPLHHQVAAKKFGTIQTLRPVSRPNALRQLFAASQYRLKNKPGQAPLLLLNSDGDRFVNPECTRHLSEFLGVPFQTHPAAGHDLPMDAPEWVLEKIEHWLQENGD